MKNTSRRLAAVLFSLSFLFLTFTLRFALQALSFSAPFLVTVEVAALFGLGAVVVKSWQSDEAFTDREKRTFVALYCLYLAVNVMTTQTELQLMGMALSTINQNLSKSIGLCWALLAGKLLLPAAGLYFACRVEGHSTVVFEVPAGPEQLADEQALEQLTVQLDEAEQQL